MTIESYRNSKRSSSYGERKKMELTLKPYHQSLIALSSNCSFVSSCQTAAKFVILKFKMTFQTKICIDTCLLSSRDRFSMRGRVKKCDEVAGNLE